MTTLTEKMLHDEKIRESLKRDRELLKRLCAEETRKNPWGKQ